MALFGKAYSSAGGWEIKFWLPHRIGSFHQVGNSPNIRILFERFSVATTIRLSNPKSHRAKIQGSRNYGPFRGSWLMKSTRPEKKVQKKSNSRKERTAVWWLKFSWKSSCLCSNWLPRIFTTQRSLQYLKSRFVNTCQAVNTFKMLTWINKFDSKTLREQRENSVSNGFGKCL